MANNVYNLSFLTYIRISVKFLPPKWTPDTVVTLDEQPADLTWLIIACVTLH